MTQRYNPTWVHRRRVPAPLLAVLVVLVAGVAACGDDDGTQPPVDQHLNVELVASGLTAPVMLREAPDETGRLFVADQAGLIRIIDADGELLAEPFLDLRSSIVDQRSGFDERGLLGLAFHPEYEANGRFFVYYSAPLSAGAPPEFDHTSHISEFRVSESDANRADAGSERVLLQVDQPQFNHDAGTVAFGPDGYLYISLGDGGGANDVGTGHVEDWYEANAGGNAQNVEANLLGKVLRIDVDSGDPYGIPADNPLIDVTPLEEIYAYGFRNPYRFSFDMAGQNDLILADAGQNRWEEVNVVVAGGNYGWNVKEGAHCFDAADPGSDAASCPEIGQFGEPLIDPVIEYANLNNEDVAGLGVVVVGGFVYRGEAVPGLVGQYIFGDWSTAFDEADGTVFAATPSGSAPWSFEELRFGEAGQSLGEYVLGFGQDLSGEVYILTSEMGGPSGSTGKVYRLVLE